MYWANGHRHNQLLRKWSQTREQEISCLWLSMWHCMHWRVAAGEWPTWWLRWVLRPEILPFIRKKMCTILWRMWSLTSPTKCLSRFLCCRSERCVGWWWMSGQSETYWCQWHISELSRAVFASVCLFPAVGRASAASSTVLTLLLLSWDAKCESVFFNMSHVIFFPLRYSVSICGRVLGTCKWNP